MPACAASCRLGPLNGFSANTEGGRLRRLMKTTVSLPCTPLPAGQESCCAVPPNRVNVPITPSSDSYLLSQILAPCGTASTPQSGRLTQDRVRELLARAGSRQQYSSEGERIQGVLQSVANCPTDPYAEPPTIVVCPPLPPPPAPPARACPLTKNQKY